MIKITPSHGDVTEVDGTKWTVNDSGELHVYKSGASEKAEPVASFARGTWMSVQVTGDRH